MSRDCVLTWSANTPPDMQPAVIVDLDRDELSWAYLHFGDFVGSTQPIDEYLAKGFGWANAPAAVDAELARVLTELAGERAVRRPSAVLARRIDLLVEHARALRSYAFLDHASREEPAARDAIDRLLAVPGDNLRVLRAMWEGGAPDRPWAVERYQRCAVDPDPALAYLADTILYDRGLPIPVRGPDNADPRVLARALPRAGFATLAAALGRALDAHVTGPMRDRDVETSLPETSQDRHEWTDRWAIGGATLRVEGVEHHHHHDGTGEITVRATIDGLPRGGRIEIHDGLRAYDATGGDEDARAFREVVRALGWDQPAPATPPRGAPAKPTPPPDERIARTRSEDPYQRYLATQALAAYPGEVAAARLVELLSDEGRGDLETQEEYYGAGLEGFRVSEAAFLALGEMPVPAVPALLAAIRGKANVMLPALMHAIDRYPTHALTVLPDRVFAQLLEWAEKLASDSRWGPTVAALRYEREFSKQVRGGSGVDPERYWTRRLDEHPRTTARAEAIRHLTRCTRDPAAFAARLVPLLDAKDLRADVAHALLELPTVLHRDTVHALAIAPWTVQSGELMRALARYHEPAAALVPRCVELIEHGGSFQPLRAAAGAALRRFGSLAEPYRARLIELLFRRATTKLSIAPHAEVDALGDPRRLADEIWPRIQAALQGDVRDRRRPLGLMLVVPPLRARLMPALVALLDPAHRKDVVLGAIEIAGELGEDARDAVAALVRLQDRPELHAAARTALAAIEGGSPARGRGDER